jgi:hypothetical protein
VQQPSFWILVSRQQVAPDAIGKHAAMRWPLHRRPRVGPVAAGAGQSTAAGCGGRSVEPPSRQSCRGHRTRRPLVVMPSSRGRMTSVSAASLP